MRIQVNSSGEKASFSLLGPVGLLILAVCSAGTILAQSKQPEARIVSVRLFKFNYDPAFDQATTFSGRTISVKEDRLYMGDVNDAGSLAAYTIKTKETGIEGYDENDLAAPDQASLMPYLSENVPTYTCYCSGHVLLMAGVRFKKGGPVPPMAIGGDALMKAAKKWGFLRHDSAEEGDAVFFFKPGNQDPDHVAFLRADGKVISKDQEERVYIASPGSINPCSFTRTSNCYKRYETWHIPWEDLNVRVVSGPIELRKDKTTGNPVRWEVLPKDLWAGDTAALHFAYRINNAPAGDMEIKAEASLHDNRGNPVGYPKSRILSPARTASRVLDGDEFFETIVQKPGRYVWTLEISARQIPSNDEGLAEYEPLTVHQAFDVKQKPAIAEMNIEGDSLQVRQNEKMTVNVKLHLTGLPTQASPVSGARPPRVEYKIESIPSVKSTDFKHFSAIAPSGEIKKEKDKTVTITGPAGQRKWKMTVRLVDVPGIAPSEAEKTSEFNYEVMPK